MNHLPHVDIEGLLTKVEAMPRELLQPATEMAWRRARRLRVPAPRLLYFAGLCAGRIADEGILLGSVGFNRDALYALRDALR